LKPKGATRILGYASLGVVAILIASFPTRARADDPFFKGKTLTITTSQGPGGVHDLIARVIARYLGDYIDGHPRIIVQNMPGGGDVTATNYMYSVAPKDGTAIAIISNSIPLHQVIDSGQLYDASKFNWIGSPGAENDAVFAWRSAGVEKVDDLKHKEIVLGGTGPGSNLVIIPTVMNNVLGTKFKIVAGYKSSNELFLAMQRGEIQARDGSYPGIISAFPSWIKENRIVFLAQDGLARDRAMPDVPLLIQLAKTDEQRKVLELISSPAALGQPYLAPPGVPAERLAVLRKAFADTMRNKAFLADAEKLGVDVDFIDDETLTKIVDRTVRAAPDVVEKARAAMSSAGGDSSKLKSKTRDEGDH
jgi:tripartite-type tricarboxylate transporter receptor subunit TctC